MKNTIIENLSTLHYYKVLFIQISFFEIMNVNGQEAMVFELIKVGRKCIEEGFLIWKLIRDAAYLVRPWIYFCFKEGVHVCLPPYKAHWIMILNSTRICVQLLPKF